jgi:hypothetical protein
MMAGFSGAGESTTMTRPRVRIGTLMLTVVIAAMSVALAVERRRSAVLSARVEALEASHQRQVARAIRQERAARDLVERFKDVVIEPEQPASGTKDR